MEQKSPQEIAKEIGESIQGLAGTQNWQSDLHPEYLVSELHYVDGGGCIPFRIVNSVTGEVFSKLPSENSPGDVDALYSDMIANHRQVELVMKPALYAAVPDLDPNADVVRLNKNGKEIILDLVDGKLVNERDVPGFPKFSVQKGAVQLDLSELSDDHKSAANAALAQFPDVVIMDAVAIEKG